MKAQILKMSGCKTEAEFYKKYPTQEAFIKKHGKEFDKLKKAQYGALEEPGRQLPGQLPFNFMGQSHQFGAGYGAPNAAMGQPQSGLAQNTAVPQVMPTNVPGPSGSAGIQTGAAEAQTKAFDTGSALKTGISAVDSVIGGFKALKAEKEALKSARTWRDVSGVVKKASESKDVDEVRMREDTARRQRQAMMPTIRGEELFPVQGTNVLAKGGGKLPTGGLERGEDYGSKGHPYPGVSKGDFAGGGRSYPIPTIQDAGDALRLAGLHGREDVKAKVYAKYPSLRKGQDGEIMNVYSPEEDLYEDGGYEPLAETSYMYEPITDEEIVKSYRSGGLIPKAQFGSFNMGGLTGMIGGAFGGAGGVGAGLGSVAGGAAAGRFNPAMLMGGLPGGVGGGSPALGGTPAGERGFSRMMGKVSENDWQGMGNAANSLVSNAFGNNAGTQIGGGIGEGLSAATGIPGLGALGSLAGGFLDKNPKRMKKAQDAMMSNIGAMSGMQNLKGFQDSYSGVMEHGGNMDYYGQPQFITHFNDIPMEDIFRQDPMMNTLRSGGHIRSNQVGEIEALSGGYLEPISYNPYTSGTGVTSMIQGQSHDESNGRHTGVILDYNGNQVEAERGEPISERQDGGPVGNNSAVIAGNQTFNELGATVIPELAEFKGKKVKDIQKKLALEDAKLNKLQAKNTKALNEFEPKTQIDKLTFNSLSMNEKGTDMKYKANANKVEHLLSYQDAVNRTAKNLGLDAGDLTRGKIKQVENPDEVARYGMEIAQDGTRKPMFAGYKGPEAPKKSSNLASPEIEREIQRRINQNPGAYPTAVIKKLRADLIKKAAEAKGKPKPSAAPKPGTAKPVVTKPTATPEEKAAFRFGQNDYTPITSTNPPANTNLVNSGKLKPITNTANQATTPKQQQAQQAAVNSYVSQYGLEAWTGNKYVTKANPYGKKTATSFSLQEWDDIAKNLGFTGKGNKEFQEFLLTNPESRKLIEARHKGLYGKDPFVDSLLGYGWAADELKGLKKKEITTTPTTTQAQDNNYDVHKYKDTGWETLAAQMLPWMRKPPGEGLRGDQLAGEMMAMKDKEEPVQARFYRPQLRTPYDISYQDQLNENQADFNAMSRQVGNNPEALAALAGQKYLANTKVLGEQFRANQAMKDQVYSGNVGTLNDALLKNMSIADTQYERQAQAKSNTKEIFKGALDSIASKIGQNRLENRQLQIGSNEFGDFSYDASGRLRKTGAPTTFNIDQMYGPDSGKITHVPMYDQNGKVIGMQQIPTSQTTQETTTTNPAVPATTQQTTTVRNGGTVRKGNLVKAFRNL